MCSSVEEEKKTTFFNTTDLSNGKYVFEMSEFWLMILLNFLKINRNSAIIIFDMPFFQFAHSYRAS